MAKHKDSRRWVIERRDESGALVLDKPQPEDVFGLDAIRGISWVDMAMCVMAHGDMHDKEYRIVGDDIANWPRFVHPQFVARLKTW